MATAELTSRLMTLLFTDLVDSSRLKVELGDADYVEHVAQPHNAIFHELLARFPGAEENNFTGDGFLATFRSVHDAVNFTLLFHHTLHAHSWKRVEPSTRIGIHLGDTVEFEGAEGDVTLLASHAADMCARVMGLGAGRQTLLTRAAFDSARQYVRIHPKTGEEPPPEIQWLAHGRYLFKGKDEPMEVFEVGAVGLAPLAAPANSDKARRMLSVEEEQTLGWRPGTSLEIPGRPQWMLEQKLGEGGFGEVWLARHERTKQQRVFKFCFDSNRLRSFKRELTLFRLIQQGLGDRADIAKLLEVRIDRPPYYLESEYVPLGNLCQWAESQGGFDQVPLETRLKFLAGVARAVAAAHSMGIIHKDIKPSNILIVERDDGAPQPVLADFGIGVLSDRALLAKHQVTETGFTESLALGNESSRTGTRLYAPPESQVGKPASTAGDVYALGVMLYQFVTGDLTRPFGTGWESDVDDELLREDISACTHRDPGRRLSSAAELAERMEQLEDRRAERAAQARAAVEREEAERRAADQSRRMRTLKIGLAVAMLFVLVAGVAAVWVNSARQEAVKQKEITEDQKKITEDQKAIAENQRDRAVTAEKEATKNLRRAHEVVDKYLLQIAEDPRLKAHGLESLRRDLLSFARQFYEEALSEQSADPEMVVMQGDTYFRLGRLTELVESRDAAIDDYAKGRDVFRGLVKAYPNNPSYQSWLAQCLNNMGLCHRDSGRLEESQPYLDESFAIRSKLAQRFPEDDGIRMQLAQIQNNLAMNAEDRGKSGEAARLYGEAASTLQSLFDKSPNDFHYKDRLARYRFNVGRALLHAGKPKRADASHRRALELRLELVKEWPGLAGVQSDLVYSYLNLSQLAASLGRGDESLEHATNARTWAEKLVRERHEIDSYVILLGAVNQRLGEIHYTAGRYQEAISHTTAVIAGLQSILDRGRRPVEILFQLAQAYNDRGFMLQQLNQKEQVEQNYLRSVELGDELLKDYPYLAGRMRVRSQVRLNLGSLYSEAKQYDDAFRWLAAAVDAANRSLKAIPNDNVLLSDVGQGLYGQAAARGKQERYVESVYFYDLSLAKKSGLQKVAVSVERVVAATGMQNARQAAEKTSDHAALASRAKQMVADNVESGFLAYHAATYYGLAARATADTDSKHFGEYSKKTMKALKNAKKHGFFNSDSAVEKLKSDTAFSAFREQQAFQDFLKELPQSEKVAFSSDFRIHHRTE